MAISLWKLAQSISTLAELDTAEDAERALRDAVEAARVLLDADTAGLLLGDAHGELGWTVTADPRAQSAADAQQRLAVGPCKEAFESGRPVVVADVAEDGRWAELLKELTAAGIRGCLSVPVTLGGGPVGVLDLYSRVPRVWDDSQTAAAQSYAGVLSLVLGATLTAAAASHLADQLQHALSTRVRIEQAKGVLMADHHLSEHAAWERLRHTARSSRRPVSAVAAEVVAEVTQQPDGQTAAGGQAASS